jgi:2-dehydropantoate 2-reductase
MTIGIFGAGSIGCYVGGLLAAAGGAPVLVGRGSMGERLKRGIEVTRFDGMTKQAAPGSFEFSEDPAALSDCDTVLVCVKSNATAAAGEALAAALKPDVAVVSLQNGVSNAAVLREAMPEQTVLAGMVGYNVAQIGGNRFHCGTEGEIVLEEGGEALAETLSAAGIPAKTAPDIAAVQWGKLLLNLNNCVNALSGKPLRPQLMDRDYRQVMAAVIGEALATLKAAGIRPAKVGRAPPGLLPAILRPAGLGCSCDSPPRC